MSTEVAVGRQSALRPDAPRPSAATRAGRFPVSYLVIGVPLVIGAVRLIEAWHRPFTGGGDVAFIELAIRHAMSHAAALGPYSRFGWYHPGAFVFYLFAPLYAVSGDSSRALFVDAWLLNAGCALAVVAVVRRFAGEAVALAGAVVVALFVGTTGFAELINPWNPSLLALPVLLTLVAAAAAATGSTGALVVAALAGSLAVQTHLSTVPVVAVALVASALAWVFARRPAVPAAGGPGTTGRWAARWWGARWRDGGWRDGGRPLVIVGLLALVGVWIGPLVQEVLRPNGNLTQIARFYLHPPPVVGVTHHGLSETLGAATAFPTTVPFASPTNLNGHRGRILVAVGYGVAGLAVAVVGRRRSRFAAGLGLATSVGLLAALVAASRVIGPLYYYLFLWSRMLAVPMLLGVMVLVAPRVAATRWAVAPRVALVVAGALSAVVVSRVIVAGKVISYGDSPDARAVAAAIEHAVGPRSSAPFRLTVVTEQFADGPVLLTLVKDGYHFAMTSPMDLYAGNVVHADNGPVFSLQPSTDTAPPAGTHLLAADGTIAAYQNG
ncbi:MAG: hypothetical protein M3137_11095 [Actinomycetota bacterium]|nr:hypothetical protein [Actinomycetota bacterium]